MHETTEGVTAAGLTGTRIERGPHRSRVKKDRETDSLMTSTSLQAVLLRDVSKMIEGRVQQLYTPALMRSLYTVVTGLYRSVELH